MNFAERLKQNWRAGVTVGLVSIPLSVSLAVASQTTPTVGIITAIWAGLVASLFGGSKFNIVGPTAALSGILAAFALTHGADALPMLAIVTGLFVLIAWALKLERWLVFIPGAAIHGFTLGVAFILALNQLNFATGLTGLATHERFISNVLESFAHLGQTSPSALILFVLTLAFLFGFLKFVPKIPGVIIAAPVGIMIGKLATAKLIPLSIITLQDKYADIAGRLFQAHAWGLSRELFVTAFAAALIAIIETMVSAKMADTMTKTKHDKRKEMLGLGLANLASGLMGGIPATAALARTSTNAKNGATHQTSATISSLTVAVISLLLLPWFKFIPMPMIAAILVFVSVRMVEREHFVRMWEHDKRSFIICLITAAITVVEDPITGVLFGTVVALLIFVERVSHGPHELVNHDASIAIYSITGQLAYLNAESHVERVRRQVGDAKTVILRLRHLYYIDLEGLDALDEIIRELQAKHKTVLLTGINSSIKPVLHESGIVRALEQQNAVYTRTSHAITALQSS